MRRRKRAPGPGGPMARLPRTDHASRGQGASAGDPALHDLPGDPDSQQQQADKNDEAPQDAEGAVVPPISHVGSRLLAALVVRTMPAIRWPTKSASRSQPVK